ncbi:transposase [Rhizobium sp. BK376]|uniref:transposase n=1 Tax=Rhizobium sp. BK376 TaxID=2512149 RepID=UPI001404598A|nr:transposase [Rhizobium sp. BK376]
MSRRLLVHLWEEARSRPIADIAHSIGLDEKTVRNALASKRVSELDNRICSVPQILGVARCHIKGRVTTVFWDVGRRNLVDIVFSDRASDVRRWLDAFPERELVSVVAIDMVEAYHRAVQEALPEARIAVHPSGLRKRFKDAADKVLKNSTLTRFKATDPYFAAHRALCASGRKFQMQTLLDLNPLMRSAMEARRNYHDVWKARTPYAAAIRLESFLNNLSLLVLRSFGDIVSVVRRWARQLADSTGIPGLKGYGAARSMLDRAVANITAEEVENGSLGRRSPFDDCSIRLCQCCDHENIRYGGGSRLPRSARFGATILNPPVAKRFRSIRWICHECNWSDAEVMLAQRPNGLLRAR